ncbi:hypothetical protein JTE90_021939 [Oedothorax gibbosus]|uniref:Uncharacterized protein n=1 Tax=Oedothorax gibbosus TaxID=931172 RepID=A0AAV6VX22_9ARAC|nr:hypothetical protein JTE90_021939 [Oedothorax gibbosus]
MKLSVTFLNSALIIQIFITNTVFTYPNPWHPILWRNPSYRPQNFDYELEQDRFIRNPRTPSPNRMLSIDLSQLMPGSTEVPLRTRHKPSSNLLGIDISVLSRNPDPKLPIVPSAFRVPGTRKMIMRDTFDPRYDRLPVITSKPVPNFRENYDNRPRNGLVYPFHHLPLNVVTTYHTVMANKKDNENADSEFDEDEREKKYTANFILHMLYQLSNSQKEIFL